MTEYIDISNGLIELLTTISGWAALAYVHLKKNQKNRTILELKLKMVNNYSSG